MEPESLAAPTAPPTDEDEERERLKLQAAERGVDPQAAIALAEQLGHLFPAAEAYRAVERRLASGMSLQDAEELLLG